MLIKSLCFAIQFACHIREDLERVNEIISENMAKLAATSSFALLRIKASFKALFIDAIQIHKSVVAIFILLSSGYYGGFLLDQMLFGGLHAIIYESNLKKKTT